ncbi:hypothetical protein OG352_00505 [Streptomyces sp. NBC_01485]|uniref:DUF4232 domain-containing protein n=1 Tax=Streptomyces sp. NBC_01485 TaxID=2903884 RepID=UPI002E352B27|nr:DUF4232 domain-containing protein [Streptomyces sp. NBC_01485]
MRSHLGTRSARLVLAATATVVLTAGLTACDPNDAAAEGSTKPSASTTGGSDGSSQEPIDSDKAKTDSHGQSCGTNDLDYTVTKTALDGILLITAKAQSGITCYLDGRTPVVLFSSAEKTMAYPPELMKTAAEDSIKLSGSTAAYVALIPNTTRAETSLEFDQMDLTLHSEDSHTAHLKLPGSYTVDKAAVTNWYTSAEAATPDAN